jgi:hypothetical protein
MLLEHSPDICQRNPRELFGEQLLDREKIYSSLLFSSMQRVNNTYQSKRFVAGTTSERPFRGTVINLRFLDFPFFVFLFRSAFSLSRFDLEDDL